MSRSSADRNMLFGVLAMQMDFVSREDLIAATSAWVQDKETPLADILLTRQMLTADEHKLLDAVVDKHLEKHGNDPAASLASVRTLAPQVCEELGRVHTDVAASMGRLSTDPATVLSMGRHVPAGERFHILRPHARGGLGEVFVARDQEVNREVALKEIQFEHAFNADSQARFLLEAEITGGLEHPGIVPVYGLGTYSDGRPYYAMRFIRGKSLDEAIKAWHNDGLPAAEKNLQFRELLKRFIDVCHAIAYAHSRGILHRDLKPGNIMLGRFGETLVVDWGLAKPIGDDAPTSQATIAEEPLLQPQGSQDSGTIAGTAVGTPGYMSPEQAAGRLDQLGPGTDVYSMGATLYHILTGRSSEAFSRGQSDARDPGSMLRRIAEGDFPGPREINPAVPRPLEAICLKGMAVKPGDRYTTVEELAADVERWLADEPVKAWREPALIRARRWIRRHPTLASTTSTVVLTALIGLVIFSAVVAGQKREVEQKNRQLVVAQGKLEQKQAELRSKNRRLEETRTELRTAFREMQTAHAALEVSEKRLTVANETARQEAATATAVSDFLKGILEETDPIALGGRMFTPKTNAASEMRTVRDVLRSGTAELDAQFPDPDQTRAMLLHTLGLAWVSYGETEEAERLFAQSRAIREELLPSGHVDRIASLLGLGRTWLVEGRVNEANEVLRAALRQCREQVQQASADEKPSVETLLGDILFDLGLLQSGAPANEYPEDWKENLEESVTIRRGQGDDRRLFLSLLALAQAHHVRDEHATAIGYMTEARALLTRLSGGERFIAAMDHLLRAQATNLVGLSGPTVAAYKQCLAEVEAILGDLHPLVTWVRRQLATYVYWNRDDLPEAEMRAAEELFARIQSDYDQLYAPDFPAVGQVLVYRCRCRRDVGDYDAARVLGEQSLQRLLDSSYPELFFLATSLDVLASVYRDGLAREVQQDGILLGPWFRDSVDLRERTLTIVPPRAEGVVEEEAAQKAAKVIGLARQHLAYQAQCRELWTAFATGDALSGDLADPVAWPPLPDGYLPSESLKQGAFLELRARLLSEKGDHARAVDAATRLRQVESVTARQLYSAARVFSLSAASLPAETPGEESDMKKEQTQAAIECLRAALAAGLKDRGQLRSDEAFRTLRTSPDFTRLLEEIPAQSEETPRED